MTTGLWAMGRWFHSPCTVEGETMILVVVVDQKLVKRWLVSVLRGAQRALQAVGTVLKRLTD